jgi:hypothetical protein
MTRTGTARAKVLLGAVPQAALAAQITLVIAAIALTTWGRGEQASPRAINGAEAQRLHYAVG